MPKGLGSLASLLGKLATPGKGEGPTGNAAKGLKSEKGEKGEGPEGPAKGEALGDGALIAGLGFSRRDRRTQLKNKVEQEHISQFLKESQKSDETPKAPEAKEAPGEAEMAEQEPQSEVKEQHEATEQELRREEAHDEARVQGHATEEPQEAKEQIEAQEADAQQHDQQEDDEDKAGGGWVLEEAEEEEKRRGKGLREADVLSDQNRCKGTVDDGSRCLRKPVKGLGYCREHSLGWKPEPRIDKV